MIKEYIFLEIFLKEQVRAADLKLYILLQRSHVKYLQVVGVSAYKIFQIY